MDEAKSRVLDEWIQEGAISKKFVIFKRFQSQASCPCVGC